MGIEASAPTASALRARALGDHGALRIITDETAIALDEAATRCLAHVLETGRLKVRAHHSMRCSIIMCSKKGFEER